jgi:hypothetical protein
MICALGSHGHTRDLRHGPHGSRGPKAFHIDSDMSTDTVCKFCALLYMYVCLYNQAGGRQYDVDSAHDTYLYIHIHTYAPYVYIYIYTIGGRPRRQLGQYSERSPVEATQPNMWRVGATLGAKRRVHGSFGRHPSVQRRATLTPGRRLVRGSGDLPQDCQGLIDVLNAAPAAVVCWFELLNSYGGLIYKFTSITHA